LPQSRNQKVDLRTISCKNFLDLSAAHQKALRSHYSNFSPAIILNPYARKSISKDRRDYVLLIDARRNEFYFEIKKLLEESRDKFSSYCCTGDADFVVEYSATENVHKMLLKEIESLLEQAPSAIGEELVTVFEIEKVFRAKGTDNNCNSNKRNFNISEEDVQKLSQIQYDYDITTSEEVRSLFGNKQSLQRFLSRLQTEQIIMGFCPLGKPKTLSTKLCVLLVYGDVGYENVILGDRRLSERVVDFYSVNKSVTDSEDSFYKHVKHLIIAEFSNINEYGKWKEYLYKVSLEKRKNINVMTFAYEDTIAEIPMGLSDYALFDKVAKSYDTSGKNMIYMGFPYFLNALKENLKICLNTHTLKENGLIIGEPSSGKTFTAMIVAKKIFGNDRRVHVVDCTGDIANKFSEVYSENEKSIVETIDTFDPTRKNIFGQNQKIHFYTPNRKNYCDLAKQMLQQIIDMQNPDTTRTTRDILIFEEAHLLFNDEATLKSILECITISGRKGFSIWFSTQKLSSFPQKLISNLRNKIVHRIDRSETKDVADMLLVRGEETLYTNLEEELVKLARGDAFVSFVFPDGAEEVERSPLKIKIMREEV